MYKIKSAIILAAGRGERLKPYTDKTPKPLLKVNDKPIIEYSIEALLSHNINDITIITGYRARQFVYLKEKYGVKLRRNPDFNNGTNLLSLKCALDKLYDCIILDGDVIIDKTTIRDEVPGSGYSYVHEDAACEWAIETKNDKIVNIIPDLTEKYDFDALHSISYWVGPQAGILRKMLANAQDNVRYADDIMIKVPNLYAYKMTHKNFIEIDTVEEYENVKRSMETTR